MSHTIHATCACACESHSARKQAERTRLTLDVPQLELGSLPPLLPSLRLTLRLLPRLLFALNLGLQLVRPLADLSDLVDEG